MEVIACDVEHFHLGVADLDALFEVRESSTHSTFNPALAVVAPIGPAMAGRSVSGRARQFCAMRQNMRCSIPAFARTSLDRARNGAGG